MNTNYLWLPIPFLGPCLIDAIIFFFKEVTLFSGKSNICVYIHIYIYTYILTHIHMHECINAYIYIHTHTCTHRKRFAMIYTKMISLGTGIKNFFPFKIIWDFWCSIYCVRSLKVAIPS